MSRLGIEERLYLALAVIVVTLIGLVAMAETDFSRLGAANNLNVHPFEMLGEAGAAGRLD